MDVDEFYQYAGDFDKIQLTFRKRLFYDLI